MLRGIDPGCSSAKNSYGTWKKNFLQTRSSRNFQNGKQTIHIDIPGLLGIPFPTGRENGSKMVDGGNVIIRYNLCDPLSIENIQHLKRPVMMLRFLNVSGQYIVLTIRLSESLSKYSTDLACGAGNEYFFLSWIHGGLR